MSERLDTVHYEENNFSSNAESNLIRLPLKGSWIQNTNKHANEPVISPDFGFTQDIMKLSAHSPSGENKRQNLSDSNNGYDSPKKLNVKKNESRGFRKSPKDSHSPTSIKEESLMKSHKHRSNKRAGTRVFGQKPKSKKSHSTVVCDDGDVESELELNDSEHEYIQELQSCNQEDESLEKQKPSKGVDEYKTEKLFGKMRRKFVVRKFEDSADPHDFDDQIHEIRNNSRIPNQEKIRWLKVAKLTNLERLEAYNDGLPFYNARKKIRRTLTRISAICSKIVANPIFEYFILAIVLVNSTILALDDPTDNVSNVPAAVDNFFLGTYTVEMVLKIAGMGFMFNKNSYLRDPWNLMDFVIVVTAYIPIIFTSNGVNLQGIRALRVLRPLRTISNIEALRVIVVTLLAALRPLLETLFVLFFVFAVFSIGGLQIFGGQLKKRCFSLEQGIVLPDENESTTNGEKYCINSGDCGIVDGVEYICGKMLTNPYYNTTNFDTILFAFLMIFQIVTLEGWSDIMYSLMKTVHPAVSLFFIAFVVIAAFFLLNLTLAVIKAEFSAHTEGAAEVQEKVEDTHQARLLARIEEHKDQIFNLVRRRRLGEIHFNKYEIKKEGLIAVNSNKRTHHTEGFAPHFERSLSKIVLLSLKGIATRTASALGVVGLIKKMLNLPSSKQRAQKKVHPSPMLPELKGDIQATENKSLFEPKVKITVIKEDIESSVTNISPMKIAPIEKALLSDRKSLLKLNEVPNHNLQPVETDENNLMTEKGKRSSFIKTGDPAAHLLLMKMNKVVKSEVGSSSKFSQKEASQGTPSLNEIDNKAGSGQTIEARAPTKLLNDSDFFDEHQQHHARRSKMMAKSHNSSKQALSNEENRHPPLLKLTSNLVGDARSPKSKNTHSRTHHHHHHNHNHHQNDGEKYVIDVRYLKPDPVYKKDYVFSSSDEVLPVRRKLELQNIVNEESDVLRNSRFKIQFKLSKIQEEFSSKASQTGKSGYAEAMGILKREKAVRVKVEKDQDEDIDIDGSIIPSRKNVSLPQSFSRKASIRHRVSPKKHRFFARNNGNNDDEFPPEKLHNFLDVLHKMKEPLNDDVDVDTTRDETRELEEIVMAQDYKLILKKDIETNVIGENNWSGHNVLALSSKAVASNRIKMSLNNQDFDIWRKGVEGLIHSLRRKVKVLVESGWFNGFIMLSVLFNTVILATQGLSLSTRTQDLFNQFNFFFTIVFIVEMGLKIFALNPFGYARDTINLFDAAIVIVSLVEQVVSTESSKHKAVSAFRAIRIFRTFRVLRVTKILRALSYMKIIIGVISRSLNKFVWIAVLLFLFVFIYALLGMQIFGGAFNFDTNVGPGRYRENFDTFWNAFIVSFQIMTQENWQEVLYLALQSKVSNIISLLYLVSWIIVGNWILLNLFLAILLDEFTGEEAEEELDEILEENEEHNANEDLSSTVRNKNNALKATSKGLPRSKSYSSQSDVSDEYNSLSSKHLNKPEVIHCRRAFFILSNDNILRRTCIRIFQHRYFENSVLIVIILSSIKLALDTYISSSNVVLSTLSTDIDFVFNSFFAFEAFIKIISLGFMFSKGSYMRDSWNILDFIIVVTSILDMALTQIDLSFIKIIRLLRTLRPLRFISHNESMRLIVTALMESVTAILNVLIVVLLVWLMFAILAINVVGDQFGFCDGMDPSESIYGISKLKCAEMGYTWAVPDANFDNIFNAMLSLFVLGTQENWTNVMYNMVDANDASVGPIEGNQRAFSYAFFVVYLFVGSYFLMNLFIGIIFMEFARVQKKESVVNKFLTADQQKWILMQQLVTASKVDTSYIEPKTQWRKKIFRFINHIYFEVFIMIIILINVIGMALAVEGASETYNLTLQYINWAFSCIFTVEMIVRLLALGFKRFWASGWNRFDAFVVATSVFDIVMDSLDNNFLDFIRFAPQLARIFRVLRLTKLFKLVKQLHGLQNLINTLIFSLPSLLNAGALLFLVFFIYAVLGVFLFKDIESGDVINDQYVNFRNFLTAILTLFRCATGEGWWSVMFDTMKPQTCVKGVKSCGSYYYGLPFWISFIFICVNIFLNLFILVILQQFEDYHLNPDNPVLNFRATLENVFKPHWEKFAMKHGGTHIHVSQLLPFFITLDQPIGYKDSDVPKKFIAKEIMQMDIYPDDHGMVFYNNVLFAAFKHGFGGGSTLEFAQFQYLMREEYKAKNRIESLKKKTLRLQIRKRPTLKPTAKANPVTRLLFMGMTMKTWVNYARMVGEKMRAAEENGIDYVHSESEDESYEEESNSESLDSYELDYDNQDTDRKDKLNQEADQQYDDEMIASNPSKGKSSIMRKDKTDNRKHVKALNYGLRDEKDALEESRSLVGYDECLTVRSEQVLDKDGLKLLSRQNVNPKPHTHLHIEGSSPKHNPPKIVQYSPENEGNDDDNVRVLYSFAEKAKSSKKRDADDDSTGKDDLGVNTEKNKPAVINNYFDADTKSQSFEGVVEVDALSKSGGSQESSTDKE